MNRVFDLLFRPFQAAHPLYSLAAFSALTGMLLLVVFRYTSNQREIRRAKDRLQAHVLAVRLFQDDLGVVLRSYGRVLAGTLAYIRYSLLPLAVIVFPLAVILAQLDMRLGCTSPRPGGSFLLKIRTAVQVSIEPVTLETPPGLHLDVPPVRMSQEREMNWRLRTERDGEFTLRVVVAGRSFEKKVVASGNLAALPAARVRNRLTQALFYPAESALPQNGLLEAIEIVYPPRAIEVAGYEMSWLLPFFVLSLVAAFAMKPLVRAEF